MAAPPLPGGTAAATLREGLYRLPAYPVKSWAMTLIVMATTLVTKTNDSSACRSAVARISLVRIGVSETWWSCRS